MSAPLAKVRRSSSSSSSSSVVVDAESGRRWRPWQELLVLLVEVLDDEEVGERRMWPPAATNVPLDVDVDGAGSHATVDTGRGSSRYNDDAHGALVDDKVSLFTSRQRRSERPALCQNSWSDSSIGDGIRCRGTR